MDADRSIMRGTGAGLLEFCDRAGERGDLTKETARGYRIAAGKILAVESDDLASIDLRQLDVGDLLERFAKLHKADFSDGSLATYRSRFRLAVSMYIAWLDDDPNWKAAGRDVRPRERGTARVATSKSAGRTRLPPPSASQTTASHAETAPADDPPSGVRLLTYDVPLRPDLIVRITLPLDLTEADADRLTAFVRSLAFSGRTPGVPEIRPVEGAG